MLHPREGVVHHDGDVEGRVTAAVALGQHVREARAEDADDVDVAEPAGGVDDGDFVVVLRQGDGARQCVRFGLVDEEDRAGEWEDCCRGGARGCGCRVEAGEVLDDATAGDGGVQGAPVEAGRQVERVDLGEELRERLDDILKKTQTNLRRLEQNDGLWPKTTSQT